MIIIIIIIKRYEERNKQFRQNRLFETDQGKFFEELEGTTNSDEGTPDTEATEKNLEGSVEPKRGAQERCGVASKRTL